MPPRHDHLVSALLELVVEFIAREPTAFISPGDRSISTPFSTTSQADWAEGVKLWNEHGRHLIAGLPKRHCPACGQDDARQLFQSYDGYPYVECIPCGCWYVPLKVEAGLFESFFGDNPKAFEVLKRTLESRNTEANHQSSLERIGAYLDELIPLLSDTSPLRYLDMGCGLGQSLQAANARGLQATGVESSRECISFATKAGWNVFHVSEQGLQQQFDLISFWESLEHMVDPAAVLQDCLQHLGPKGLLAFTVPNQNSPLVRTQREDCNFINGGYDTPGHINLFNPTTIERLLDRSGYALLALDGQYSLNLGELISYLLGSQRSAYDLLQGKIVHNKLSEESNALLQSIGPVCALLERTTLTAPILFGFACHKNDVGHFAPAITLYNQNRREQLLSQIRNMEPASSKMAALQQRSDAMARIKYLEDQQQLSNAIARIKYLEDQLLLAHNPFIRFVRFVRSKLNPPKG